MRTSVIFFDLDDTLVASTAIYERALQAVGTSMRDKAYSQARSAVKQRLPAGHVAARNRLLYFKEMLEAGGTFTPRRCLEQMAAYEAALSLEFKRSWEASGHAAVLATLSAKAEVLVVTNENTRTQLLKLAAIDPEGVYLRRVFTSEEVGSEKPLPHLLQRAMATVTAPPAACVMVGDDPDKDCAVAAGLGVRAILTAEFCAQSAEAMATYKTINRLSELPALLGLS